MAGRECLNTRIPFLGTPLTRRTRTDIVDGNPEFQIAIDLRHNAFSGLSRVYEYMCESICVNNVENNYTTITTRREKRHYDVRLSNRALRKTIHRIITA